MGAAEARLFARQGARLVLADVLDEPLRKLTDELAAAGHDVLAHRLDVTVEATWSKVAAAAEAHFGGLHVLVNNAGVADAAGIEDTSREVWDRTIAVNQTGTWLGIKTCAPAMRRAGGGSMINISSIYGIVGSTGSSAYHASKGAVRTLTKQAAVEYANEGIRVNSIHPGYIDTAMLRGPFEGRPADLEEIIASTTPMGRVGTAEEIANAALFLASDESSFMTGAEMVVDGGYTAR
jgi:NAD(P)-dependent dehydrogenase (short-subunit alcohol dehydrogenase family)